MHVELTVCDESDERADVGVDAPDGATLAEVARAVRTAVGARTDAPLWVDADRPDATTPAVVALRTGAVLADRRQPGAPGPGAVLVVGGPDAGTWADLDCPALVGRDETCDLVLTDVMVSRRHLRIDRVAGGISVLDLGSTNGTQLFRASGDDSPGTGHVAVGAGDLVRIGSSLLSFGPALPVRTRRALPAGHLPELPDRPDREPRRRTSTAHGRTWSAALVPVAVAAAIAWISGSPTMLLFAAAGPATMLVGTALGGRAGLRARRARGHGRVSGDPTRRSALLGPARRTGPSGEPVSSAGDPGWWLDPVRLERRLAGGRDGVWDARNTTSLPVCVGTTTAKDTAAWPSPLVVDLATEELELAIPRDAARAAARWAVCQSAVRLSPADLQVVLLTDEPATAAWHWLRWLPHLRQPPLTSSAGLEGLAAQLRSSAGPNPVPVLLVVLDAGDDLAASARSMLRAIRSAGGVLATISVRRRATRPDTPICRLVATADGAGRAHVQRAGVPDVPLSGPRASEGARTPDVLATERIAGQQVAMDQVPVEWAERVARLLAAKADRTVRSGGTDRADTAPPAPGRSAATGPEPTAVARSALASDAVRSDTEDGLAVTLGADDTGPVGVDLVADGPHTLVGGTTGSGKSHLLRTIVLGLALTYSPDLVAFVLVDYKGGATFADCAELPHVAGCVSDLDPHLAHRSLVLLEAELRRREALLAAARASDLTAFRRSGGILARLVVVIDEFAALSHDAPDLLRSIVAAAARGRSLGIHLVLATQRPGAAITPDIKANTNLRIALRVQDAGESREIVDVPDAAAFATDRPGQAVLRRGAGRPKQFRVGPAGGAWARPMPQVVTVSALGPWRRGPTVDDAAGNRDDPASVAIRRASAARRPRSPVPWLPPLPGRVVLDVPATARRRLPVGLLDLPARQEHSPLLVDLDEPASWLVVGGPGSGRSTALRTVLAAATRWGAPDDPAIHLVEAASAPFPSGARLCSQLGPDGSDRVALLLSRLREACESADAEGPSLLLLDDWDRLLDAQDDLTAAELGDALGALLRCAHGGALTVVVTGGRTLLANRVAAAFDHRLLLRLSDAADYALAGVPVATRPTSGGPGRGVRVADGVEFQIALPGRHAPPPDRGVRSDAAGAVVVRALPRLVRLDDAPGSPPQLGVGGDRALPITLAPGEPGRWLVVGPPGSGRTTTLATVLTAARRGETDCVVLAPARSALHRVAAALRVPALRPGQDDALLASWQGPVLLVVDDCDEAADGELGDAIALRLRRDAMARIVVAGEPAAFASAYRGLPALARRFRRGIALRPGIADGELFGVRLPRSSAAQPAGRGQLIGVVAGRQPVAVQIAVPGCASVTAYGGNDDPFQA